MKLDTRIQHRDQAMDRLHTQFVLLLLTISIAWGCRGAQVAHVLEQDDPDMVGSHVAGAETWKPLIDESVGRLLGRDLSEIQQASLSGNPTGCKRICFVGVENRSAEEIGDFKEQIYEHIDTLLSQSDMYSSISRRYVETGLREGRMRPDDLFIPDRQQAFAAIMQRMDQPFDYLLFAKITSGTTQNNKSYQRDYLLTLEMVDINSGEYTKESATLRKGYHKSKLGQLKNYGK